MVGIRMGWRHGIRVVAEGKRKPKTKTSKKQTSKEISRRFRASREEFEAAVDAAIDVCRRSCRKRAGGRVALKHLKLVQKCLNVKERGQEMVYDVLCVREANGVGLAKSAGWVVVIAGLSLRAFPVEDVVPL